MSVNNQYLIIANIKNVLCRKIKIIVVVSGNHMYRTIYQ